MSAYQKDQQPLLELALIHSFVVFFYFFLTGHKFIKPTPRNAPDGNPLLIFLAGQSSTFAP